MLFDFEPSGINDSCLRVTRGTGACILCPAGTWNGLVRLNHLIASQGGAEPYLIFRAAEVGYDDGRFSWRGRARPVSASPQMLDVLVERGLATAQEVERFRYGGMNGDLGGVADTSLMLKAALRGAAFAPLYAPDNSVNGYALRTLADPHVFVLEVRDGLPALDEPARLALRRQVEGT